MKFVVDDDDVSELVYQRNVQLPLLKTGFSPMLVFVLGW